MSVGMVAYRCFLLDPDKRPRSAQVAELRDDQAAIEWAARLLDADPRSAAIEVWQVARLVCRHERTL
jgi:hypothetical protein